MDESLSKSLSFHMGHKASHCRLQTV